MHDVDKTMWVSIYLFHLQLVLMRNRTLTPWNTWLVPRVRLFVTSGGLMMICTCSKNNLLFYGMVPDSLPELPNSLGPRVLLLIHLWQQHLIHVNDLSTLILQILQVQDLFRYSLGITRQLPLKKVVYQNSKISFDGTALDLKLAWSSWRDWPPGPRYEVVVQSSSPSTTSRWNNSSPCLFSAFHLSNHVNHIVVILSSNKGPRGGVEQGKAAQEVKYLRLRRSLKVFFQLWQMACNNSNIKYSIFNIQISNIQISTSLKISQGIFSTLACKSMSQCNNLEIISLIQ